MSFEESEAYSKYRKELKSIFDDNSSKVSREMLEEFEFFLRDNWSAEDLKLYRYSSADFYNLRNFEKGKIRLTNNGVLNDVFEGLPRGITDEQIKSVGDIVYMKCFSTDYKSNLMWSHYADNNKGICVEYDIGLLEQNNSIFKNIYPIIYCQKRPFEISIKEIAEIVESQKWLNYDIQNKGIADYNKLFQVLSLFLFKGEEWEYEKEWRVIYTKAEIYSGNYADVLNPTVDFDCATGIYLGYRMDQEIKEGIMEIVDRINNKRIENSRDCITVYEAKLKTDTYGFEFCKIY